MHHNVRDAFQCILVQPTTTHYPQPTTRHYPCSCSESTFALHNILLPLLMQRIISFFGAAPTPGGPTCPNMSPSAVTSLPPARDDGGGDDHCDSDGDRFPSLSSSKYYNYHQIIMMLILIFIIFFRIITTLIHSLETITQNPFKAFIGAFVTAG